MDKINLLADENRCRKQNKTTDYYLSVSNKTNGVFGTLIFLV